MPKLPRISAQRGRISPDPTPDDFEAAVARGAGAIGAGLTQAAQVTAGILRVKAAEESATAATRASLEMEEARRQTEAEQPDAAALETDLKKKLPGIVSRNRPKGGSAAQSYDQAIALHQQRIQMSLNNTIRQRGVDGIREDVVDNEGLVLRLAAGTMEPALVTDLRAAHLVKISRAVETGAYTREQGAKIRNAFIDAYDTTRRAAIFTGGVQLAVDTIMDDPTLNDTQRLEAARSIDNTLMRDEAVKRVEHRNALRRNQEAAAKKVVSDTTWDRIGEGGGYDAIPESVTGKERREMESAIKRAKGQPLRFPTDVGHWNELYVEAINNPGVFAKRDLRRSRTRLEKTWYDEFSRWQEALLGGAPEAPYNKGDLSLFDKVISQQAVRAGASGPDKITRDSMKLAYMNATAAARSAKREAGDPLAELTEDERLELMNGIIEQGALTVPSAWFSWTFAAFGENVLPRNMTLEQVDKLVASPPDELRLAARAAAKVRIAEVGGNRAPTDEELEAFMRSALAQLGADVE